MKNDIESSYIIVPENIKSEIGEKGFYLYRWITSTEIRMSIERDFLKILKYVGPALSIISILSYFFTGSFYFFLGTILFGVILIVSFLLGISVYRSFLLIKNSFVVISNKSIFVGGKVFDLSDEKGLEKNTKYIAKVFNEKLFGISWLELNKNTFYIDIGKDLLSGFSQIYNYSGAKGGKSGQLVIISLLLYLVYIILLSVSYFIGVLILWIFTIFLTFINNLILRIIGNKPILINNLFISISKSSKNLLKNKDSIFDLLNDALDNEWENGLLTKINSFIVSINNEAKQSIDNSISLKKHIEDSPYESIIDFSIYENWLRKQLKEPLIEIKELLIINIEALSKSISNIDLKLKKVKRKSLLSSLELQKERLVLQTDNIEKNILTLDLYIRKL